MTNKNTLILIDGSSYLYRAYHGVPSFINSQGMPTGAIYGMTNMLKSLLHDYQPTHTAIVFDAKGKTFRHELFPEYKANRPPMPDELVAQISLTHEIVQALGFPLIMENGVEADDVIGTLTKQAQAAGMHTLIFTGDKDFAQLVNDSVTLIDTLKKTRLGVQGVIDKFGIPPELIVDYLSLMGDTVDNVPGVKKVGPKTAVKWLQNYGNLDAVIENAAQFKGKIGENLRDALSDFPLTRQLLTIKCDVPLSHTPQQLKLNAPDVNKLQQLYLELEFKQWLTKTPPKPKQYHTILTQNDFDKWLKRLNDASLFAFDTETTSLDYLQAEIVGVSFAVQAGEAAYIPLTHDYLGVPQQLSRDEVLAALKPLLENKPKIGQNLKYDAHVLANHGINLQAIAFDTLLESYILDSTATRHDLDSLALKYLKLETIHFEDIAGKGKKQLPFNQIDIEQAAPYAAEDADVALQLHEKLWPQLQSIPKLCQIFTEMEMPLLPVLMRMERNGVKIDAAQLQKHSAELAQSLQVIEKQAYELAGTEFNLNSPKQLQSILFDKLGLPVLKKTPKKEPSTAVDVLEELAIDYPLPKLILEYRSLSKLKSTYTDALPQQIKPKTGRVHTSYQQAVTATGRLSSTNPNLQNIPIRTASGRRIRQAFIADDGYQLIAADYSQIELRIMAHLSQDEKLLSAFAAGEDIHKATAAEVFEVPIEKVTSEQRRNAKAVNFGLIYGMQAFGLAKQLGIERREAQIYIDTYFARYPGVKTYMEETRELAQKQGYVETIFGRRLYIPDIKSRSRQRRQHAERTAINMPLQGTCADILKKSLLLIDNWIQSSGLDVKIILQVHDELVLETKASILEEVGRKVGELMKESALPIDVPVNIGIGNNWDEAH